MRKTAWGLAIITALLFLAAAETQFVHLAGNAGTSGKIFFTVKLFPTTLLIIAVATVTATGGAALAFFAEARKTRRKAE